MIFNPGTAVQSRPSQVVLTTARKEDDAVVEEARRAGVASFRGPDRDVLSRFCMAAARFGSDVIVRATADNPLIDIGSIDRIVEALQSGSLDYCMEKNLPTGAATEAITREALEQVSRLARLPHQREHVTIYVKEHSADFRTAFPDAPEGLRFPQLRITVDTPADFIFMQSLILSMPENRQPIPLADYLKSLPSAISTRIS